MQSSHWRIVARDLICVLAVISAAGCNQPADALRHGDKNNSPMTPRRRPSKTTGSRCGGNCQGHGPGAWGTSGGIGSKAVAAFPTRHSWPGPATPCLNGEAGAWHSRLNQRTMAEGRFEVRPFTRIESPKLTNWRRAARVARAARLF